VSAALYAWLENWFTRFMPDEPEPPRKLYKLKEAEFERVNPLLETPGAAAPHQDVHSILRENLARADAAGLNALTPKTRRRSRRKRDYWMLLFLGNAFFGAAVAYFGFKSMPGTFAFGGMIFFSCALTWIMWFIVDNY
jgi:hypothetical protein